jgi:hypothetical protein
MFQVYVCGYGVGLNFKVKVSCRRLMLLNKIKF